MSDWIKHYGEGCPVDGRKTVLVQRQNGNFEINQAGYMNWGQYGFACDIIAYQVITPYKPTDD